MQARKAAPATAAEDAVAAAAAAMSHQPPGDAVVDVGASPAHVPDADAGSSSSASSSSSNAQPPPAAASAPSGMMGILSDALDVNEGYEYLDQPDPDAKHVEPPDHAGARLTRAVLYFTRGNAIPWIPLVGVTIYSLIAVLVSWGASRNWSGNDDDVCSSRWWCTPISVDSGVASYVGFALFLLLGFRVNESYGRYMEAVRLWNDVIAGNTGALAMYITLAIPRGTFHERDVERMLGLLAAFSECTKRELRDEKDLRELKGMLGPRDLAAIQSADNMAGHCLYLLHGYMVAASRTPSLNLPGPFYTMMMNKVLALAGANGSCMRIRTYQMAYSYGNHLRLFLLLWLFLLPLAIVETSGWLTILWVPFITLGIWGSETAAQELADPFGYDYNDIRLGVFTSNIRDTIKTVYRYSLRTTPDHNTDTPDMLACEPTPPVGSPTAVS